MKILSISGCNLASLKGEFHLHLDRPPFKEKGLFAIRGATGSGKSTIIDAMCLALYGRTPRLGERGGVLVGPAGQEDAERLSANDVRGIIHRGAGECWAEVVFRGVDGRRWRSRWSVRRAALRANGRLQLAAMSLQDVDEPTTRFAGNIGEVREACRAKLGLSFDQFKRSALLAQGEFAAFAKANERERSELLEAMTGTGIYTRISIAAQRRHSLEKQKGEDLRAQRERLGLLDANDRAKREGELADARGRIQVLEREVAEAAQQERWHERHLELERLWQDADAKAQEAGRSSLGTDERRRILETVESAQPMAPLRAGLIREEQEEQRLRAEIQAKEGLMPDLVAEEAEHRRAEEAATAARDRILQEGCELDPQILAARALDIQTENAAGRLRQAQTEAEDLGKALADARGILRDLDGRAGELDEDRKEVQGRLQADQDLTVLEPDWSSHSVDLKELADGHTESEAKKLLLEETRQKAADLAADRDAKARELDLKTLEHEILLTSVGDLETRLAADPRVQLDRERATAQEALDAGRRAESLLKALRPMLDQRADQGQAGKDQAEAARVALRQAEEARVALADLEPSLREAKGARDRAQQALSLEDQRALLEEGVACPLCGAMDHPWATGSPVAGLMEGLRARAEELEAGKSALAGEETLARARAEDAAVAVDRIGKLLGDLQNRIAREHTAWASIRSAWPELPADPEAPGTSAVVHDAALDAEERLERVQAREKACAQRETDLENLRKREREAAKARQEMEKKVSALDGEIREAHIKVSTLEGELGRLAKEMALRLERLRGALPEGVVRSLPAAAKELYESLETRIAEFRNLKRESEGLAQSIAELEGRRTVQAALVEAKLGEAERGAARAREVEKEWRDRAQERSSVLEGRAVQDVVSELEKKQAEAKVALSAASEAHKAAWKRLEDLKTAVHTLQGQVPVARNAVAKARAAFAEGLARWGGDHSRLEELLAWEPEAVRNEREDLAEMDRTLGKAKAVAAERRGELETHRAGTRPSRTREEAKAFLEASQAERDGLKENAWTLVLVLQRDDDAHRLAGALDEEIRLQGIQTGLWESMNSVIGSSDGKKFQVYAQSLTLDALLAYANEDLAKLNGRYELQRIPWSNLEIQVLDRDMGGEARALESLSGGETFLVSLALALGLSALSANDTPIHSLFIDEGFGSLDPQTLETSLMVLDELQSQGRQVGIISHVEGFEAHIPVQVRVEKLGGGRSRLIPPAGAMQRLEESGTSAAVPCEPIASLAP